MPAGRRSWRPVSAQVHGPEAPTRCLRGGDEHLEVGLGNARATLQLAFELAEQLRAQVAKATPWIEHCHEG